MDLATLLRSAFMPGEAGGMPDGGYGSSTGSGQQMPGTYGSRASQLKRQRELADLLREQASEKTKDNYVPGWTSALTGAGMSPQLVGGGNDAALNIMKGLGGVAAGYQNRKLDEQAAVLDQQAKDEAQRAAMGLPSMTGTRTVEQTVPGEGVPVEQAAPAVVPTSPYGTSESLPSTPGTMLPQARAQMTRTPDTVKQVQEQYALSPEEYSTNLSKFGATLDPTNPYTSDLRGAVLKQALSMPEKIMESRDRAASLAEIAKEKYENQRAIAQQQHEARMATLQSQEERAREMMSFRVAQHNSDIEFKRQMAQMNAGFKQQGLDIQREGLAGRLADKQAKADEKVKEKELAQEGVDRQLENVQKTAGKLIDVNTGAAKEGLHKGTGVYNAMLPNALVGQKSNEARKDLKTLQNQMTMISLADAKKAAGQSFGSMQVQEWEKFQNQVTNLDIDNPSVEKDIKEVYDYAARIRNGLKAASAPASAASGAPAGVDAAVWNVMTPEEKALWTK